MPGFPITCVGIILSGGAIDGGGSAVSGGEGVGEPENGLEGGLDALTFPISSPAAFTNYPCAQKSRYLIMGRH